MEIQLGAHFRCNSKTVGDRMGWRLPSIQELASLVDPTWTNPANPALPAGHPFSNVQFGGTLFDQQRYWSATSLDAGISAFAVFFGVNTPHVNANVKTDLEFVWCVRGGQGVDLQ